MNENLYLETEASLNETTALIRKMEKAKTNLERRINEAKSRAGELKRTMTSVEGFESWLASKNIPFERFIETSDGVIWWLVKVDNATGTLVLLEDHPKLPCLCCHERMAFSPYELEYIKDEEEVRGPDKGFRKDWSEPLILACKDLGCTRLETMGFETADRAQKVTPLPVEWDGRRSELEQLILPPLYYS